MLRCPTLVASLLMLLVTFSAGDARWMDDVGFPDRALQGGALVWIFLFCLLAYIPLLVLVASYALRDLMALYLYRNRRAAVSLLLFVVSKRPAVPPCRPRAIVRAQTRSACGMPVVGKQLVDAAVQVGGQAGQHVIEVSPRIVSLKLG